MFVQQLRNQNLCQSNVDLSKGQVGVQRPSNGARSTAKVNNGIISAGTARWPNLSNSMGTLAASIKQYDRAQCSVRLYGSCCEKHATLHQPCPLPEDSTRPGNVLHDHWIMTHGPEEYGIL